MRRITNIIGLLALLVVGGAAAWKWMPHRLSYDECSDVYRHFADMQLRGVQVTYVRDKVVNDTLRLPVTLLKAETDEGWKAIDDIFGCSRQIDEILNEPVPILSRGNSLRCHPHFTPTAPTAKRRR